ncbi:MAG: response regulator transcription factor [Acidimicrobiales bacterium]|nr:response regulator transcription factor [Acidimicrobiales bacterium]
MIQEPATDPSADHPLSDRRQEVLELLAEGETPKHIARRLGITMSTCRGHIQDILDAFDAQNALQAVLLAQRNGMLRCRCGDDSEGTHLGRAVRSIVPP